MKLLLATTSPGKIREQRAALEGLPVEIVTLDAFPGIDPPDEPGPGFSDNAAVKALYYHSATGLSALGEDSGLVVDALAGAPGVHSARWLGKETSYEAKNAEILKRLEGRSPDERAARYVSAVALAVAGDIAFRAERACEGRIAEKPSGDGGFGYDPIFFYPPLGRTMAELSAEEKNGVSHRGLAMAELVAFLQSL